MYLILAMALIGIGGRYAVLAKRVSAMRGFCLTYSFSAWVDRATPALVVAMICGWGSLAQAQSSGAGGSWTERELSRLRTALRLEPGDERALRRAAAKLARADRGFGGPTETLILRAKAERGVDGADGPQGADGAEVDRPRRIGARGRRSAGARVAGLAREPENAAGEMLIRVPAGVSASTLAAVLLETGDYEYAEPDVWLMPASVPDDPLFSASVQHGPIRSVGAWGMVTGSGVTVAVVDSGIDLDHPDLIDRLVPGYHAPLRLAAVDGGPTDDVNTVGLFVGHGTFIAGLAGATGNNGIGVTGVGWGLGLMPIRVTDSPLGSAVLSDITAGARWAAENGARVVSVSFSGVTSPTVQTTGAYLKSQNALLLWAAGNDGARLPDTPFPDVVVVTSTTASDVLSSFSNTGGLVSVAAPGSSVRSTMIGGGFGIGSGTSFSTPIAAGVAALIMSANPGLTADQAQSILLGTADDLGAPGEDDEFGAGRVNALRAVTAALGGAVIELPFELGFEDGLIGAVWEAESGVSVEAPPLPSGDGSLALAFEPGGVVESGRIVIDLADAGRGVLVGFESLDRGVPGGQSLKAEYLDPSGQWRPLSIARSLSPAGRTGFQAYRGLIPAGDVSLDLRVRFTADAGSAGKWWIDAFSLRAAARVEPPLFDPVLAGVALAESDVFQASTAASVVPDALATDGAAIAIAGTSQFVSRFFESTPAFAADPVVRFDVRPDGVPAGQLLRVDFFDNLGRRTAMTLGPEALDPERYTPVELLLPGFVPSGFGFNAVYIERATAGPGSWLIDEVAIGAGYAPPVGANAQPCNAADLSDSPIGSGVFGQHDGQDISMFILAFIAGIPPADLSRTPPANGVFGTYDGNDIGEFVTVFLNGCPDD